MPCKYYTLDVESEGDYGNMKVSDLFYYFFGSYYSSLFFFLFQGS
jgi:hypothetical protein